MYFLALITWLFSLCLLLFALKFFLVKRAVAGVAVLVILFIQLYIRPLIFFCFLDEPYPYEFFDMDSWALIAEASLFSTAWIILFVVGYVVSFPMSRFSQYMFPMTPGSIDKRFLFGLALALTLVSLVSTAILVSRYGSIANFVYSVKIAKNLAGSYAFRAISVHASIISTLGLFVRVMSKEEGKLVSSFFQIPTYVVLIVINFGIIFTWGNRYAFALLSLAMVVGWHLAVKRLNWGKIILTGLVAFTLFHSLKFVRILMVSETLSREIVTDHGFWTSLSTSLHFNQFDAFMLALRDTGVLFEFRNGADFWNGLVSWVPRFILPNKETFHIGGWFRQVYQPEIINGWPVSVIGSWYVNFGVVGVFFGGLFSGAIARTVDFAYRDISSSPWAAVVGPSIAFTMLDGGYNTGFPQSVVLFLIPIFVFRFALSFRG